VSTARYGLDHGQLLSVTCGILSYNLYNYNYKAY